MSKQAMTLALDALIYCQTAGIKIANVTDAIAALKEAIKQHDAEPVGVVCEDDISGIDVWEVIDWTSGERPPVGTKLYLSAPSIPEGFVLVRKEPTDEMVARGFYIHPCRPGESKVTDAYRAMLAASPQPTKGEQRNN